MSVQMDALCRYLHSNPTDMDVTSIISLPTILTNIVKFVKYDELLVLNDKFRKFYTNNRKLGKKDLLWKEIRRQLVASRSIEIELSDSGSISPNYFMLKMRKNVLAKPFRAANVRCLDIYLHRESYVNQSVFFRFNFDFRALTGLKTLILTEVELDNILVNPLTITTLKIHQLPNGYNERDVTRFITPFQNLNELTLGTLPDDTLISPVSHSLKFIQFSTLSGNSYLISKFLALHADTLEMIHFDIGTSDAKNVIELLSINNVQFSKVRNIKFSSVSFAIPRVNGKFKLPLHPFTFPSLKHLTFGMTKHMGNYKHNHQFFEFNGLYEIILRPTSMTFVDVRINRKLLHTLNSMSKGDFTYHFINVPMCLPFDEERWLLDNDKSCHNKRLDYWNGYCSLKNTQI